MYCKSLHRNSEMPSDRTSAGFVCISFRIQIRRVDHGQGKVTEDPYFLPGMEGSLTSASFTEHFLYHGNNYYCTTHGTVHLHYMFWSLERLCWLPRDAHRSCTMVAAIRCSVLLRNSNTQKLLETTMLLFYFPH